MNAIIFYIVDNIKDNGAILLIMVSIMNSSLQTGKCLTTYHSLHRNPFPLRNQSHDGHH